jgi:hypothetical protein
MTIELVAEEEVKATKPLVKKRKRKEITSVKKTTTDNKKGSSGKKKKRSGLLDDLTPQRRREINHIIRRVKRHAIITPAFLTSALRSSKLASDKIERIEEYKTTLAKQQEHSLQKAKDEDKKKRIQAQFERRLARLGRIGLSFSKGNRVCLKATDEVFLSKIKLPKPLSGYMLFAKESREKIQTENSSAGFGEIGRLIGTEWKKLTEDERLDWKKRAGKAPLV